MHQQVRVVPAASPSDLAKLLGVLAAADVNIVAAGGGNIELGDEFAFVPSDGQEETAMSALADAGYAPRLLNAGDDYKLCWLTNELGQLRSCIDEASKENNGRGFKIKDILVGIEPEDGKIGVQVYSVAPETAD
jgi:hypothetical protein